MTTEAAHFPEDGATHTEVIMRPNGSVYRRRKPIAVEALSWNDEGMCVLVYGTHDPQRAHDLAAAEWARECEGEMPEPTAIWVKKVPWDALGYGWSSTVLEVGGNTKGSTPALQYWNDPWCPTRLARPADRIGA